MKEMHNIIINLIIICKIFDQGLINEEDNLVLKMAYAEIMVDCALETQKELMHTILHFLLANSAHSEENIYTILNVQEKKELKENDEGDSILALAELAYSFEQNGEVAEHAKKLSLACGALKNIIAYLNAFACHNKNNPQLVHDACLFTLPSGEYDVFAWRSIVSNNTWYHLVKDEEFRKYILPSADKIEASLKAQARTSEQLPFDTAAIKDKKLQLDALKKRWGNFKKNPENNFQVFLKTVNNCLPKLLMNEYAKLIFINAEKNISAAIEFKKHGLTQKEFDEYLSLKPIDSKEIPDLLISGKDIGLPHFPYYLKKLDPADPRAACLGKITDCCQSLGGAGGECARYGITSEHSGFYVICKGNALHSKDTDPIVSQSWAWRSKNSALVLDSIESLQKNAEGNFEQHKNVDLWIALYNELARRLVDDKSFAITKVMVGQGGQTPQNMGFAAVAEKWIDYPGYNSDSRKQRILASQTIPLSELYILSLDFPGAVSVREAAQLRLSEANNKVTWDIKATFNVVENLQFNANKITLFFNLFSFLPREMIQSYNVSDLIRLNPLWCDEEIVSKLDLTIVKWLMMQRLLPEQFYHVVKDSIIKAANVDMVEFWYNFGLDFYDQLSAAIQGKHFSIVQCIVDHDTNNRIGFNALYLAEKFEVENIVEYLLQKRNDLSQILPVVKFLLKTIKEKDSGFFDFLLNQDFVFLAKELIQLAEEFKKHNLSPKDFDKYLSLIPIDSKSIPDIFIGGEDIEYLDCPYYLQKLNPSDSRIPYLGKFTDNVESLGDAGESAIVYGITSEHGGFYAICQGNSKSPKESDPIITHSFAWRSKSNVLVLDSIKVRPAERRFKEEPCKALYMEFAKRVVDDKSFGITSVQVGEGSQFFYEIGFSSAVAVSEQPIGYKGYRSLPVQDMLSSQKMPLSELYILSSGFLERKSAKEFSQQMLHEFPNNANWDIKETLVFIKEYKDTLRKIHYVYILFKFLPQEIVQDLQIRDFLSIDYASEVSFYYHNNSIIARWLVEQNLLVCDSYRALISAVINAGDLEMVKFLDKHGWHMVKQLSVAVSRHHFHIVQYLVEKKCIVEDYCGKRVCAGKEMITEDTLSAAVKAGDLEILQYLVNQRADLFIIDDNPTKRHWLFEAVRAQQWHVLEFLLMYGFNINHRDHKGETILHVVVYYGNVDRVKYLLDHGADINAQTNNHITPLQLAVDSRSLNMVKLLVAQPGINIDIKNTLFNSYNFEYEIHTLLLFNSYNFEYEIHTLLYRAVKEGLTDIVKCLLENGFKFDVQSGEEIVIQQASAEIQQLFREYVQDQEAKITKEQRAVLILNMYPNGQQESLSLLKENVNVVGVEIGANPINMTTDPNATNNFLCVCNMM